MMTKRFVKLASLSMLVALAAGCDKIADTSRAVQSVTKHAFEDTKSSWKDFFTYHPPVPDSLPQTRYCYQMQSDVVCYDSEQPKLTSKLVGFQDGETISWVQPGGGSLGASGGPAVALRPALKPRTTDYSRNADDGQAAASAMTDPVQVNDMVVPSKPGSKAEKWGYSKDSDTYRKLSAADGVTVGELPAK